MNFESFASRIMDIKEYTWFQKIPAKLRQMRFQIKNTNMRLTSVNRTQFAGLNDKRYYLPNGITSLPYGHFLMSEMRRKKAIQTHSKCHNENKGRFDKRGI